MRSRLHGKRGMLSWRRPLFRSRQQAKKHSVLEAGTLSFL